MSSNDTNRLPGIPQGDPDAQWRAGLPPELQPVAERHGRELFATVMNINSANAQLALLSSWARGNNAATSAIQAAAHNLNQLAVALISAKGWTTQQLAEAGGDIQRAAALANGGGKIILPGRTVN